jgi:hypothetical protein
LRGSSLFRIPLPVFLLFPSAKLFKCKYIYKAAHEQERVRF